VICYFDTNPTFHAHRWTLLSCSPAPRRPPCSGCAGVRRGLGKTEQEERLTESGARSSEPDQQLREAGTEARAPPLCVRGPATTVLARELLPPSSPSRPAGPARFTASTAADRGRARTNRGWWRGLHRRPEPDLPRAGEERPFSFTHREALLLLIRRGGGGAGLC
jgi:hypothetical protein